MKTSRYAEEIKHDLRTLLAASKDLGPSYDEHLIDSLVDKLQAQLPAHPRADAQMPMILRWPRPMWRRNSFPLLGLGLVAVTLLLAHGTWSLRHLAAVFFLLLCLVAISLLVVQVALAVCRHRRLPRTTIPH